MEIEPIDSKDSFEALMEKLENDSIKELISKFKYYDNEELTKVIESLLSKLVQDGTFVDATDFQDDWFTLSQTHVSAATVF